MAAYAPSRVLRQYGLMQVIPVVEDLNSWFFELAVGSSKFNEVRRGKVARSI
jgi:hypothetical protein